MLRGGEGDWLIPEPLQFLLFVGFAGLMLLLRLDARRFSAAEWDTEDGDARVWLPRPSRGTRRDWRSD